MLPLMYTAPPYNYKKEEVGFLEQEPGLSGHVGLSLSGFSLSRGRSGITKHSSQPTPLLAETWELPSLSRLACIPCYKPSGCKIIQCPLAPLCWTYGPATGTRINRALLCCLLHYYLGRENTQHLFVGIRAPGSGHRQYPLRQGQPFASPGTALSLRSRGGNGE